LIKEQKQKSGHVVLIWLTILPVLYVLSLGPAIAISSKAWFPIPDKFIEAFYAPLIWLHDNTSLAGAFEAYAKLWGWHW